MVKLLHDIDFLIDVLLKKRLLLDVLFADNFDCVEHLG